jgi:triosephosphate isomerase
MENRKPLIAGNWKMYKTCAEAAETAGKLKELTAGISDVDIMIAPTFTALSAVADVVRDSQVGLGAQNLFWEKEGAYTGEISAPMLVSVGCSYVIIGHSERRQYFGETDDSVNKKIKSAITSKLIPILCVGETESERESKDTFSVLDKQISNGLKGFSSNELDTLVIAYEPVWAIGTGKTATSDQAQEVHQFLRSLIEKNFGKSLAKSVRILYGGSVKPDNVRELMGMADVDGALVGGASLNAETFSKIVHFK